MNRSTRIIYPELMPEETRASVFRDAIAVHNKTRHAVCINPPFFYFLRRLGLIGVLSVLSGFLVASEAVAQGFRGNQPTFFEEGHEQLERTIEQLQQSQPEPVLTIDANVQQWQPIASQVGGFSVWVPLGILSDDTETISMGTTELEFRILSSQTSIGKFVVAYADVPENESAQLFASVKDALVERTAFAISNVEPITVDGAVGEFLILTSDAGVISVYVLLGGDRLYVVGVRQPDRSAPTEAATRFLTSFHLNSD